MQITSLGQLFIIGAGGFIGTIARVSMVGLVYRVLPLATFPYGTLAVNVLGCLAIGFLGGLMESHAELSISQQRFWIVGVLGGFTTYSAFAYETLGSIQAADFDLLLLNVVGHLVFGLAAAWLGFTAAQYL